MRRELISRQSSLSGDAQRLSFINFFLVNSLKSKKTKDLLADCPPRAIPSVRLGSFPAEHSTAERPQVAWGPSLMDSVALALFLRDCRVDGLNPFEESSPQSGHPRISPAWQGATSARCLGVTANSPSISRSDLWASVASGDLCPS